MREVARGFRESRTPADVIYLDIDYMDGFRVFTWNKERFPDPSKMIADLRAEGFRVVLIIDPGVKVDPNYYAYQQGQAGGHESRASAVPPRSGDNDAVHAVARTPFGPPANAPQA